MLLYEHYRIVYRADGDVVEIIGVYHGALDLAQRIGTVESDTVNE